MHNSEKTNVVASTTQIENQDGPGYKAIIDGKRYDTRTATLITKRDNL